MRSKKKKFISFNHCCSADSQEIRPEDEAELCQCFPFVKSNGILARGMGRSYNDCSLNDQGHIVNMNRMNHLIHFNENKAILECQGGVCLKDLFLPHPQYIPAVLPGTVNVTVAGCIANDVHGKNHPCEGSFADHIESFQLITGQEKRECSKTINPELFYATIGGLGLTGVITQVAVKLRCASRCVSYNSSLFTELDTLMQRMLKDKKNVEYQAAWLDLLNKPQSILFQAQHTQAPCKFNYHQITLPNLPLRLIYPFTMKLYNYYYSRFHQGKKSSESLIKFNNPLDTIKNWNQLYGRKGFVQFQAVIPFDNAFNSIQHLIDIINREKATPTLAVLKILDRTAQGLLSFCQPGFTIAIDFIHNSAARKTISILNQFICEIKGKVYLAKDILLTKEQFQQMYPKHEAFKKILHDYNSPMQSDLGRRLGVLP